MIYGRGLAGEDYVELLAGAERAKLEVMLCGLRGKFALEPYRSRC